MQRNGMKQKRKRKQILKQSVVFGIHTQSLTHTRTHRGTHTRAHTADSRHWPKYGNLDGFRDIWGYFLFLFVFLFLGRVGSILSYISSKYKFVEAKSILTSLAWNRH